MKELIISAILCSTFLQVHYLREMYLGWVTSYKIILSNEIILNTNSGFRYQNYSHYSSIPQKSWMASGREMRAISSIRDQRNSRQQLLQQQQRQQLQQQQMQQQVRGIRHKSQHLFRRKLTDILQTTKTMISMSTKRCQNTKTTISMSTESCRSTKTIILMPTAINCRQKSRMMDSAVMRVTALEGAS